MQDLVVHVPNTHHFAKIVPRIPKAFGKAKMMTKVLKTLTSKVKQDDITDEISRMFDYQFDGETTFDVPDCSPPEDFGIGLIVGPSGSGKSQLLRKFGEPAEPEWNNKIAVASHFDSADDAEQSLCGVGFNSIPSWLRPYSALSTGEKFRADMARTIQDGACIDEFTSVVDRDVAKSCAFAIARLIKQRGYRRVVFATCHYDIAEWLQPDWVFDTKSRQMLARGSLQRPSRIIDIAPCDSKYWHIFSPHHYLSENINKSSRCWAANWNGQTVGFTAAITMPNGYIKNAWREHRTVVLPDFQGLGFGVRISDAVGEIFISEGCRYFSKTAHPRMGGYREASDKWRPTSKNMQKRPDYAHNRETKESGYMHLHRDRWTYAHEYVGTPVQTGRGSE